MMKINWKFWKKETGIPNLANGVVKEDVPENGFHEFPQAGKKRWLRSKKVWGIVGGVLVLLVLLLALPGIAIYSSAKNVQASSEQLLASLREQDIPKIREALTETREDVLSLQKGVNRIFWVKHTPFLGGYWRDADHAVRGGIAGIDALALAVDTLEPYADILGFEGEVSGLTKTAEDRITFLVTTLDQLIPQFEPISEKTDIMASEFNQINPNRYPQYFRGTEIREKIRVGIRVINQANDLITNGRPFLEQLPYLAGVEEERTYLLLFQNDKELRPTGGFLTAYSIVTVKNGVLTPSVSTDIYNLDRRFNSRIPAPRIIADYLPLVPYWHLRDMNLSPDFKVSMDTFSENYGNVANLDELDGIIAIDTNPAVWLLEATGPIGVTGYGNFSADADPRCDCPNIIYELESYADTVHPVVWDPNTGEIVFKPANYDNRKDILGPLMRSIMANAMGQPKEKMAQMFDAVWRSISGKHVMFYMFDPEVQAAVESFNLAGKIREYDGDYLHINDANFAGAKSNLYVQEEVELEVTPSSSGSTNFLKIRYKNPQPADGWLNGHFRDVLRIYVPQGSQLVDSTGSDEEVKTYDELGKTVFEAFFVLRPLGVTELTFQYKTPVTKTDDYGILIQKQPGTDGYPYRVTVGSGAEEFLLLVDKELKF